MPLLSHRPLVGERRRPVRSLLGPLVAGLVLGLTVAPLAPASAADAWGVPGDARIVITGHGYGHGHGLSQYGAEGAARAGLGYREIADFYYPGTRWGTAKGSVSVLVSADTTDDVVVRPRSGLMLRAVGSGREWMLPDKGASRWRLRAGSGGRTVASYHRGSWQTWKVLPGDGEFHASGRPVRLVTPGGTRAYRGRLRAASPVPGGRRRDTVNVLSLESYLRGVVPLEMPALWSPDAVRAQAVAARTYAAYERAHPRAEHYQICDTTSCQVYGGFDAEQAASSAAIAATRGQILTAGGAPAFTQFSASSGGWTSAGSARYLVAQADPYDGWDGNPVHDWSVTLTDRVIERRFRGIGDLRRIVVAERDGNGEWGGRVLSLTLVGTKGRVRVSGDELRSALGLRSTWLTFRIR